MTPLDKNKVWEEHCRKEALKYKPSTECCIHPTSVPDLAPKPNARGDRFLDKDAIFLEAGEKRREERQRREEAARRGEKVRTPSPHPEEVDGEFTKALRARGTVPADRYRRPRSCSNEYGWFHEPLMERTELNYKPRNTCEVTRFAQELVKSQPRPGGN